MPVLSIADAGVILDNSYFITIKDITLSSDRKRGTRFDGSWGVWLKNGADNLVTSFNISTVNTYDIALQVRLGWNVSYITRVRDEDTERPVAASTIVHKLDDTFSEMMHSSCCNNVCVHDLKLGMSQAVQCIW